MPDLMTEEFDDIIRALREERPEIDPRFARSLDQRAADGFPKPPWHVRLPSFVWYGAPAGAVATLVVVAALAGGSAGSAESNALALRRVATGLSSPVFVTAPRSEPSRIYIVEQVGRIRVLVGGRLRAAPFLDIRNLVVSGG